VKVWTIRIAGSVAGNFEDDDGP